MTSGNYGPGQPNEPYGQQPQYGQPAQGQPQGPPPGEAPAPPPSQPPSQPPTQPQYGAAPQGQPPMYGDQQSYGGYGQQYPPPPPARATARPGVAGLVVAVLGAVAAVIAFTATKWYSDFSAPSHFHDIHKLVNTAGNEGTWIAKAYFSWLAWVLLAAALVAAIIANLPTQASPPMRALGALISLLGIGATFWALKLNEHGSPGYSQWLKHAAKEPSLYLAAGGFLLLFIGSLVGPRRV